jgi:hypothetical protein
MDYRYSVLAGYMLALQCNGRDESVARHWEPRAVDDNEYAYLVDASIDAVVRAAGRGTERTGRRRPPFRPSLGLQPREVHALNIGALAWAQCAGGLLPLLEPEQMRPRFLERVSSYTQGQIVAVSGAPEPADAGL